MGSKEKQQRYDGYIERPSLAAEAIGRKAPYHLEYARQHGGVAAPTGPSAEQRKGGRECKKGTSKNS